MSQRSLSSCETLMSGLTMLGTCRTSVMVTFHGIVHTAANVLICCTPDLSDPHQVLISCEGVGLLSVLT